MIFGDGATYTFVYGTAIGRSGTISTFTAAKNDTTGSTPGVFNFSKSDTVPTSGDYMIVKKVMPGGATEGWNYITGANGSVTTNTTDLPSGTLGIQTIALNAPSQGDNADLYIYLDGTSGQTFLQFNGSYSLSFKAKSLGGSNSVYVTLARDNYPSTVYIAQTVALSNVWQTYTIPFTGSDAGLVATAELHFKTAAPNLGSPASSFEMDDVSLVQTSNQDTSNTTVFRDPVVKALKQLNPGVLRFWFNQEGETLDNFLAPDTGRQRSAYSGYGASGDINTPYVEYNLPEFLQLCQLVGSGSNTTPIEPWVVIPITLSPTEASNLIDYLAGPTTTVYGALRASQGQTAPWTSVFPKIHLEFGNEAWNKLFYGGAMTNGQAYGTRGQLIFGTMRSNPNFKSTAFDLMLNGNAFDSNGIPGIQAYCNNNDSFADQPYLMLNADDPAASGLTGAAATENLFGSTLTQPEAYVTNNGLIQQNMAAAESSGRPVQFAITETNISPYGGSITQAELNTYVSSMGAGLAVIDSMLQNTRIGILTQNVFALPGFQFYRSDGKSMYLFGSVVDMGVTDLKRPQFLAEQVANNAIGANTIMLQTLHTGLDPTFNQPSVNGVQLNGAHYLQSFAFNGGGNYSLIVINTNRTASEQVNFGGTNIPAGTVQMTQLTSTNITDTNETASVVAPVSSSLTSFNAAAGMSLPPFSITTLTWNAPAISNITVSAITGTSATITWSTDTPSTTQVNYGTTTAYGSQSPLDGTLSTSHSVMLTGLGAGTIYDFSVSSTNAAGATAGSANASFGTPASFAISASAAVTIQQGAAASVPVTVTPTNGYTGSVTLSVSGLPTSASGTFQTGAGGATLIINIPTVVNAGTYPLTLTGTAGSTVVTTPISLTVSQTLATSVSLASSFNVYGIFNNGSTVTNGGLDNSSYAYSSNLLGSSLTLGVNYSFAAPGSADAASSTTLPLTAGNYANLNFLGTAVGSTQTAQVFTVNYTDGTTSTFTQSLSDWGAPQSYPGENIALKMAYRVSPSGGQNSGPWQLYEYSFPLNSAKTVKSFTLPNNRDVTVLAVTLSGSGASLAQTITFNTVATQTVGSTLALAASASSGLGITYTASPNAVCTVSAATATFVAAGTCTITASQAGNSNYAAATAVSQSFTVQAAAPVATTIVSLGSTANIYGIFSNGTTVTNGGLDTSSYAYSANLLGTGLVFQGIPYTLGTPGSASAASSTTLALPSGSYSALNFLGTAIYGNQAAQTFSVTYTDNTTSTLTQSMSDWGSPQAYSGESDASIMAYRLTSTGSQQAGPWYLYAYSFPLNSAKTVRSFTLPNNRNVTLLAVTLSGSGSATLTTQSITFGTIASQTVGTPLTLTATATSGLAVTYVPSTTSICTIAGTTATFVAAGTCTITASQAGNSTYAAATPVSQSFTVSAAALKAQTITFTTIAAQTVGTPLTLTSTATSGLAVSYASSTAGVCTISGTTATFVVAGTCTITASQAGNGTYAAATPVSQSFTVSAAALKAQTITFTTIAAQTIGTPLTLTATATSGLTVTYVSSTTSTCTIAGTTATFVAAGTCTIAAAQAGNATYAAASTVTQSFSVSAAPLKTQTITFGTIAAQNVGTPLTLSATATSGLAVTYTSTTTSICTVSGTTATFLAAGTCTITAAQSGNTTYAPATPVSQSITVNAAPTTVSLASASNIYGIFANGSTVTNGGLDSASYSYSSTLLPSSLTAGGIPFTLGAAGKADAVSNARVTLPSGSYSTLNFLATGVFGSQTNQTFTVTYTDGTTSVATRSLSDWGNSQSFAGESVASTMAYRLTSSGAQQAGPWYLYKYSIALNSTKTVKSITLPSNRSVIVLAMTLSH